MLTSIRRRWIHRMAVALLAALSTPEDLYSRPGLERLDTRFRRFLFERESALAGHLAAARAYGDAPA